MGAYSLNKPDGQCPLSTLAERVRRSVNAEPPTFLRHLSSTLLSWSITISVTTSRGRSAYHRVDPLPCLQAADRHARARGPVRRRSGPWVCRAAPDDSGQPMRFSGPLLAAAAQPGGIPVLPRLALRLTVTHVGELRRSEVDLLRRSTVVRRAGLSAAAIHSA